MDEIIRGIKKSRKGTIPVLIEVPMSLKERERERERANQPAARHPCLVDDDVCCCDVAPESSLCTSAWKDSRYRNHFHLADVVAPAALVLIAVDAPYSHTAAAVFEHPANDCNVDCIHSLSSSYYFVI